jgi:hypothetical protein
LHDIPPCIEGPFSRSSSWNNASTHFKNFANMGVSRLQLDLELVHLSFVINEIYETTWFGVLQTS